jgi:hypothetical protein
MIRIAILSISLVFATGAAQSKDAKSWTGM